jgi:hypothetical protein
MSDPDLAIRLHRQHQTQLSQVHGQGVLAAEYLHGGLYSTASGELEGTDHHVLWLRPCDRAEDTIAGRQSAITRGLITGRRKTLKCGSYVSTNGAVVTLCHMRLSSSRMSKAATHACTSL